MLPTALIKAISSSLSTTPSRSLPSSFGCSLFLAGALLPLVSVPSQQAGLLYAVVSPSQCCTLSEPTVTEPYG
jgi:hypothetical protein